MAPDNALRARCEVAFVDARAAVLVLEAPGAPTRVFRSEVAARDHEIEGWGLRPDTTYTWSVGATTGALRTGSLPVELSNAAISVAGEPFGFDAVLQAVRCERMWLTMVDGDGQVVWYQDSEVYDGPVDGYEWSAPERSLVAVNRTELEVLGIDGRRTQRFLAPDDFPGALHHDAERWGGYTYALFEERVGLRDVDGFHVFDDDGLVGSFHLIDHLEIPNDDQAGNYTHANGLNATKDGVLIVSLLEFDTVFAVDGDPASATFLDLLWSVAGSDARLLPPDYVAAVGPLEGFRGQHHAQLVDDRLWLFDNHGDGVRSRAARYRLEPGLGTFHLDAAWWLDRDCPIQSGAAPIDGGVLASCAGAGTASAFREGAVRPAFTLTVDCNDSGVPGGTRAIPIQYPR